MPSMTRAAKITLHLAATAVVIALVAISTGCEPAPTVKLSAAAERGRSLVRAVCSACHNSINPHEKGIQGPAIAGSSRELVAAKVLRGEYPPGYTPKRATSIMPKQPMFKDRIGDIVAFLAEVPAPGQ